MPRSACRINFGLQSCDKLTINLIKLSLIFKFLTAIMVVGARVGSRFAYFAMSLAM
jgi:hypothetical protein